MFPRSLRATAQQVVLSRIARRRIWADWSFRSSNSKYSRADEAAHLGMVALLSRRAGIDIGLRFLDQLYREPTHEIRFVTRPVERAAIDPPFAIHACHPVVIAQRNPRYRPVTPGSTRPSMSSGGSIPRIAATVAERSTVRAGSSWRPGAMSFPAKTSGTCES